MTPARRWLVHCLIVAVLGGHLVCLAAGRQVWPFSHYPMFAEGRAKRPVVRATILVGVAPDGAEFWLDGRQNLGSSLSPFLYGRPFGADARKSDGMPEIQRRLGEMFRYANDQRGRAWTPAPPMTALRLYDVEWDLDPTLSNREAPRMTRVAAWEPGVSGVSGGQP